jgi:hypothetical protein
VSEVLKLRERITGLEAQLEAGRTRPPESARELAQGTDMFTLGYRFSARRESPGYAGYEDDPYTAELQLTWNDIFAAVAPTIINEAPNRNLTRSLRQFFEARARQGLERAKKLKGLALHDFSFKETDTDTCLVQFRALGLIRVSDKPRSIKDTATYWALTPYGDYVMTQLRALRRSSEAPDPSVEPKTED